MKNKSLKFYGKLFLSTFYLSAFTFGGGYVIVPLMKKKFVDSYHWLDEKEMMDLTAIAQASPGAIAVNASIILGYRMAGILGAIIAVLGTVLPPLIILSIVSVAYTSFIQNQAVKYILKGLQAGVAAIIVDVVITMIRDVVKKKRLLPILVMTGAFVAVFFLKINIMWIIICCGLIGSIFLKDNKESKTGG